MKDFWQWVIKAFQPQIQDEIENYLSQAVDIKDLEERMKRIMYRGMPI
jgi:DNA-binding transcriptional regulator GbsR (MarR family)